MNHDAFAQLLRQYLKVIHKVVNAYCRAPGDREDVTQEIILALWGSRHRYDPSFGSSTWIYRTSLNVAISFYRREVKHRPRNPGPVTEPGEALIQVVRDAAPASEASAELEALQGCIAELGELNRALVLLYLDGRDHTSISEILGLSVSNVATKLQRIKASLRRCIDRNAKESVT